jgi:hypothetical protein
MGCGKAQSTHGRVGAPNVDVGIGDRLAGLVVDDLDGQRQGDTLLAAGNVLPDLLAKNVWGISAPDLATTCQQYEGGDVHSGPWSTEGINMHAPASENSVLRSIPLDTALLVLWSILDTEM